MGVSSDECFPGGSNGTVNAVCLTTKETMASWAGHALPRKLCVQLDNTSGENKNRYVMAFCEELVSRGVFDEIIVSFLLTGHTHDDVDRKLSRISVAVKQRDITSLQVFHKVIERSQTPEPRARRLESMTNYKDATILSRTHTTFQ